MFKAARTCGWVRELVIGPRELGVRVKLIRVVSERIKIELGNDRSRGLRELKVGNVIGVVKGSGVWGLRVFRGCEI